MAEAGGSKAPDAVVATLAAAKRSSEKTFGQIAAETGLTNVYVAQLFRRQAQLKPDAVTALRSSVPALTDDLVSEMMSPPFRSFRPDLIQEPTIYRLNEAVMHFGESIKEIINEDFGDGIMSAIDFYCSVDKVKGVDGKDRVVITFDGKYLPYSEQTKELGCQPTPSKLHARTHKHAADSSWVDRRAHYTGDNFDRECTASSQATSEGANVRMPSVQSSFELSKKTADAKKKGRVDGLGATTAAFEQGSSSSYSGPPANMISSEQLEIIKAELKAELKAKMKDDIKAIMATQFVRLEKLEKKLRKKFKSDVKRKRKGRMEEEEDSDDIESD